MKFWNSLPAWLKKQGQKRPVVKFIQLMTKAGGVCSSREINTMMQACPCKSYVPK